MSKRRLMLRTMAMPQDANPLGSMFGGWLLGQMDLAAGLAAGEVARGPTTTVAIDGVRFLRPVRPGETVQCHATLQRTGRSSMTFLVELDARASPVHEPDAASVATFTMVALDADGRPRPVGTSPMDQNVASQMRDAR